MVKKTILVVDSDSDAAFTIAACIRRWSPHNIITELTVEEAQKQLLSGRIDVMVTTASIPTHAEGLEGAGLAKIAAACKIPAIILTTLEAKIPILQGMAPAAKVINRRWGLDELLNEVKAFLD